MKDDRNRTAAARKAAATREINTLTQELHNVKEKARQGWNCYLGEPIQRVIFQLSTELDTIRHKRANLNSLL